MDQTWVSVLPRWKCKWAELWALTEARSNSGQIGFETLNWASFPILIGSRCPNTEIEHMGSKPKCNLGQVWAISILIRDHVRYSPGSYILQILKGCDQDVPSIPHVQDPFPNNKKNSRPILKTSSQTKSATGVKWISRTSSKIVLHFLKMGRHNSVICFLLPSHLLDQTWSQRSKI